MQVKKGDWLEVVQIPEGTNLQKGSLGYVMSDGNLWNSPTTPVLWHKPDGTPEKIQTFYIHESKVTVLGRRVPWPIFDYAKRTYTIPGSNVKHLNLMGGVIDRPFKVENNIEIFFYGEDSEVLGLQGTGCRYVFAQGVWAEVIPPSSSQKPEDLIQEARRRYKAGMVIQPVGVDGNPLKREVNIPEEELKNLQHFKDSARPKSNYIGVYGIPGFFHANGKWAEIKKDVQQPSPPSPEDLILEAKEKYKPGMVILPVSSNGYFRSETVCIPEGELEKTKNYGNLGPGGSICIGTPDMVGFLYVGGIWAEIKAGPAAPSSPEKPASKDPKKYLFHGDPALDLSSYPIVKLLSVVGFGICFYNGRLWILDTVHNQEFEASLDTNDPKYVDILLEYIEKTINERYRVGDLIECLIISHDTAQVKTPIRKEHLKLEWGSDFCKVKITRGSCPSVQFSARTNSVYLFRVYAGESKEWAKVINREPDLKLAGQSNSSLLAYPQTPDNSYPVLPQYLVAFARNLGIGCKIEQSPFSGEYLIEWSHGEGMSRRMESIRVQSSSELQEPETLSRISWCLLAIAEPLLLEKVKLAYPEGTVIENEEGKRKLLQYSALDISFEVVPGKSITVAVHLIFGPSIPWVLLLLCTPMSLRITPIQNVSPELKTSNQVVKLTDTREEEPQMRLLERPIGSITVIKPLE